MLKALYKKSNFASEALKHLAIIGCCGLELPINVFNNNITLPQLIGKCYNVRI